METDGKELMIGGLCALGATAIWAGNFIIARGFHHSLSPVGLAFWRWFAACVFVVPFALKDVVRQRRVIAKHLGYLAFCGFFGVTVFNTLIYVAGQVTGALNLSLIAMTCPLYMVILAGLFFGERIHRGKIIGMTTAFFGVVLLFSGGSLSTLLGLRFNHGDLLMAMGAVLFAIYSLMVRKKPVQLSMMAYLASTFWLGTLFLLPVYIWDHGFSGAFRLPMDSLGVIVYTGLGASLISYGLWNRSVELMGASRTAAVYYTMPLFSGFEAFLFLGETMTWVHAASAALIISGLFFSNRERKA